VLGLGTTTHPDDRGRPVEIWTPASFEREQLLRSDPEIPRAVLDRIMSAWTDPKNSLMRAPFTRANRPFLLIAVPLFLGYMLLLGIGMPLTRGSPVVVGVAAFGFIIGWRFVHVRWRKFILGRAVRETLVAEGLCAGCAYRLHGIPAEDDGCTVCPECRAAWRVPKDIPSPAELRADDRSARGNDNPVLRMVTFGVFGRPYVVATQDDAGRLVELVTPAIRRSPTPGWETLDEATRRAIIRELNAKVRMKRVGFAVATAAYGLVAGIMLVRAASFTPALSMGYISHMLPVFAFAMLTVWLGAMVVRPSIRDRRGYAGVLTGRGLCGRCATDLTRVRRDENGIARCPACGASWKLPDPPPPPPGPSPDAVPGARPDRRP
jgi:Zn-finger nucleic acid-binding protein